MSEKFFNYIAERMIGYFDQECSNKNLNDGDRFCFKLDTPDLVQKVYDALKYYVYSKDRLGSFSYQNYDTFTVKCIGREIVIAAQVGGMTNDFFATLRNIPIQVNKNPILMITCTPIDTISSATRDLSASGMPFCAGKILKDLADNINRAHLSDTERVLLKYELQQKQKDHFADQRSLFEYQGLITAVCTDGKLSNQNWYDLRLLPDTDGLQQNKGTKQRIEENHKDFERIDQIFKFGNFREELSNEFDTVFINRLVENKKNELPWYEGITYAEARQSKARKEKKLNTQLIIDNESISAYCSSPEEYQFQQGHTFLVRDGGTTPTKQREKHILIYNPDRKAVLTIHVPFNKTVSKKYIDIKDPKVAQNCGDARNLQLQIHADGCVFVTAVISDPGNEKTKFQLKICVLDLSPLYLENIQTCYKIDGTRKSRRIIAETTDKCLVINPGKSEQVNAVIREQEVYSCNFDTSLNLFLDENSIVRDNGKVFFSLSCGSLQIPMGISGESVRTIRLTGISAFKIKNEKHQGFEYRDKKIVMGTASYYADSSFLEKLTCESFIIDEKALYTVKQSTGKYISQKITIPENIKGAYTHFLSLFLERRSLPSLAYYDEELCKAAEVYVAAYWDFFGQIKEGDTLSKEQNDVLKLGTVFDPFRNVIAFSSVHPLNVMYQLQLRQEAGLDGMRSDIVSRLTSANLIPYIRGEQAAPYEIVEQDESPEWKYYMAIDERHSHKSRDFVPGLVMEKIEEYYSHFKFLFQDISEHRMILSLHNLGNCREIFMGIIRYFQKNIKENIKKDINSPEELLNFEVNIYSDENDTAYHNDFSVLANLKRTREYLQDIDDNYEGNSELAAMLIRKIRIYIHRGKADQYRYAHIAFYEMLSNITPGDSQISGLTTGTSLNGILSGVPSVLDNGWYKTGFGMRYAPKTRLNNFAALMNSVYRVAYSGSTYIPDHCITTEVSKESSDQLDKVYSAANWVVFIAPKVNLSFFSRSEQAKDLLIIHYGDQNSSASGYNSITVTRKAKQYENIIAHELEKKHISADFDKIKQIINFFNAVNGRWLLRLISSKRALESTFSREKMSIISAVKFALAYYNSANIVWIPVSLEELLRVSGNTGLSKNGGLLSAKNLSFDHGATCDDLLFIGIEKSNQKIYVHLHPIEVKIGQNSAAVIDKAKNQILNTHKGLLNALWPEGKERDTIERKVVRNFMMQIAVLSCEKMKLYKIGKETQWDFVLNQCRKDLLNENYEISEEVNKHIGIGTIISFKQGEDLAVLSEMDEANNISILQLPEYSGYAYLVKAEEEIISDINQMDSPLPKLSEMTEPNPIQEIKEYEPVENTEHVSVKEIPAVQKIPTEEHTEAAGATLPQISVEDQTPAGGISILFGQDQNTGKPLFWHPGDTDEVFHTNTGIIGTMGTGKTQFTQSLVTQLYRERFHNVGNPDIGILIFDYKGDYNESKPNFIQATDAKVLRPYHLPYNPFAITKSPVFKPLLPLHVANTFVDTLFDTYHLGQKQRDSLCTCVMEAYNEKGILSKEPDTWTLPAPTIQDVYNAYMGNDDIKKGDSLEAALRTLSRYEVFEADSAKTMSLFDLLKGVVVIDISGYEKHLQNLVIAITLDLFYAQMQAQGSSKLEGQYRQLTKIILVDEADNFLHEGVASLKKILKEGREFGVGTILSTQFLKHFGNGDDDFSKYIWTWVVHNVADLKNSDIRFVFHTDANSEEEDKLFSDVKKLKKHYSIIKIGNQNPVYVKDKPFWEIFDELQDRNGNRS